jgi:hypothetical protein
MADIRFKLEEARQRLETVKERQDKKAKNCDPA